MSDVSFVELCDAVEHAVKPEVVITSADGTKRIYHQKWQSVVLNKGLTGYTLGNLTYLPDEIILDVKKTGKLLLLNLDGNHTLAGVVTDNLIPLGRIN
jgi:hypothetical protein